MGGDLSGFTDDSDKFSPKNVLQRNNWPTYTSHPSKTFKWQITARIEKCHDPLHLYIGDTSPSMQLALHHHSSVLSGMTSKQQYPPGQAQTSCSAYVAARK